MRCLSPLVLTALWASAPGNALAVPQVETPAELRAVSVEVRGLVSNVSGTITGPHYGAAAGDSFRLVFDVALEPSPRGPEAPAIAGMRYLDIRPETVTMELGGTSEAGAASAEVGLATVTNDAPGDTLAFTLYLPSGATVRVRAGDETGRALAFLELDRVAPIELVRSAFASATFRIEDGRSGTFTGTVETIAIGGPTALGDVYCESSPNSTGAVAGVVATGSPSVEANRVTLIAQALPEGAFGFFLAGRGRATMAQAGGSTGTLCLGEPVGRFIDPGQILYSGPSGEFSLQIDLGEVPQPGGSITVTPGSTWNFQAWHRDPGAGGTSQFTSALEIRFQ